jgi:CRP-like cAMP-binding protein
MQTSRFRNYLLQSLSPAIIDRFHLSPVRLEVGRVMESPGDSIDNLFFIEDGVGSMTATFMDGSEVEIGMFGCESVIGISALMGTKRSLNKVYMQLAGSGYMSPIEAARMEFARCEDFQRLALRYVQTQLIQATQTAACNARHNIEQRLARWLLLVEDRAGTSTLRISHQFLADMLGVTRPSVAITAHQLRDRGLIDYQRAIIQITDREGLERCTCECYGLVRQHLDNFAQFEAELSSPL